MNSLYDAPQWSAIAPRGHPNRWQGPKGLAINQNALYRILEGRLL